MDEAATKKRTAVIIGAGPAGLTAALELLRQTDIIPIVLEKAPQPGGISRTVRFGENRMDIGGHRFFSKSDKVVQWWLDVLPLEDDTDGSLKLTYQNATHTIQQMPYSADAPHAGMMVRKRKSRIFYNGKFFDYPIVLSFQTLRNLGFMKMMKIGISYARSLLFPIRDEKTLEDFFVNRFGQELYHTFFKTYTEKVWGLPCNELGADWGRQRVKSLSVWKAVQNSFVRLFRKATLAQKHVETSLIEYFLYPKYGPGQMWETVASMVEEQGGSVIYGAAVVKLENDAGQVYSATYTDSTTGESHTIHADYFFSTMPINELFAAFTHEAPEAVKDTAQQLQFRDFVTVGLLLQDDALDQLTDNWIYIHDPSVQVGRIQLFRNWSPFMVGTPQAHVLGFEYFCNTTDRLWNMTPQELGALATSELHAIGLAESKVLSYHVEKVPKAYPVYAGVYKDFSRIKEYLNCLTNFFPIGRNGMHRYNNQDHSMLTAMASVETILGTYRKEDVWNINAEEDYHEER